MSVGRIKVFKIKDKQLRLEMLKSINKVELEESVIKVQKLVNGLKRYNCIFQFILFCSLEFKPVYRILIRYEKRTR